MSAASAGRTVPPARIGLAAAATVFVVAIGTIIWVELAHGTGQHLGEMLSVMVAFASFFGVGLAVAWRRPEHPIGWLFLATGLYPVMQAALSGLGEWRMAEGGTEALTVVANTAFSWPALLATLVVFVPLLFPTGHLPSPRWRWLAWLTGAGIGVMVVSGILRRDICVDYDSDNGCLARIDNPVGLSWMPDVEEHMIGDVTLGILMVCMVGAGASVVLRYRRSRGVERAQLRWIAFSFGLFIAYVLIGGILLEEVLGLGEELQSLAPFGIDLFGLFLSFVPISVGVAILRYRLYDIDRIISRTVGYGLLTAVLLSAYAGVVFVVGRLLPDQSDLAVAASTLAVAALFNPVRRRVQTGVDRRFNRTRYDSQLVVERFGVRLRSETGLEDLSRDLVAAAGTTMQPAWASLWLRGEKP